MVPCWVQRSFLLELLVIYGVILNAAGSAFKDFDYPTCPELIGGAENETASGNSSCVYKQCLETEAILDIPISLLEDYVLDFSKIVLVTADGCRVKEHKVSNKNFNYVRLTVPYDDCDTEKQINVGGYIYYKSRPYLAYIGIRGSQYYLVNITCKFKQRLPEVETTWGIVPNVEGCWSPDRFFTIPLIGDAEVTVHYIQLNTKGKSNAKTRGSLINGNNFKLITFESDAEYGLAQIKNYGNIYKNYQLGEIITSRASISVTDARPWFTVATVKDGNRRASFSLLPRCALGQEHATISYPSKDSHVIIVASHLGHWQLQTQVEVFFPNGLNAATVVLIPGQSTIIPNATTGYRIWSDQPVGVFTVMLDSKVPAIGVDLTEDHMVDQVPPVTLWGSEYVVHPVGTEKGFLIQIVSYKRTVQLEYFGVDGSGFPQTLEPFSHETFDVGESTSFVVRSKNGTRFMIAVIGKSSQSKDPEPKNYPYFVILKPTRSNVPLDNWFPSGDFGTECVTLAANVADKQDIRYNNITTRIPDKFWSDIDCSNSVSCIDSNHAYFQHEVSPLSGSSLLFSNNVTFSTTILLRDDTGFAVHSGSGVFKAAHPEDDHCELGWSYYQPSNECIKLVLQYKPWILAKFECENVGGTLVTLEDKDKADFVYNIATQMQLEYPAVHIGFAMRSGDLTWLTGGLVYQNGKLVEKYGDFESHNCGSLFFDKVKEEDFHVYQGYKIKPHQCVSNEYFVCQKAAEEQIVTTSSPATTARPVETTVVPTPAPEPSPCPYNPCYGGKCILENNVTICLCKPGRTGPHCGEKLTPESGIYEIFSKQANLHDLLKKPRLKRGGGGEIKEEIKPTKQKSLIFEVIRFGLMYGLRVLSPCPHSEKCYGWLAKSEGGRVYIRSSKYGPYLIRMDPYYHYYGNFSTEYRFSFDFSPYYIGYSDSYEHFYLAPPGSETITFSFKRLNEPDQSSSSHLLKVPMLRYELTRPICKKPVQSVIMPLLNKSCNSSATICLWFRTYKTRYRYKMSAFAPILILYNISKIALDNELKNTERGDECGVLKQYEVFSVKPIFWNPANFSFGVYYNNTLIASTQTIHVPYYSIRHHMCLQRHQITLDGTPLKLSFVQPNIHFVVGEDVTTFIATGSFLGEIDGFDVWCGDKSKNFLFVESATFPECGGPRGDMASMADGDAIITGNITVKHIQTRESACQFCPSGWVLHHGSCFHLTDEPTAVGPEAMNSHESICPKENGIEVAWPASARFFSSHNLLARYVDATLGEESGLAWFGLYLDGRDKWKWSNVTDPINHYFWGNDEPNIPSNFEDVCGLYKPSASDIEWFPMSPTTDITMGASSINNYQWGTMICSVPLPTLCEQRCRLLYPGKTTVLRLFMLEGSYVAKYNEPHELDEYRIAMKSIASVISKVASGPVIYEMLRIRSKTEVDTSTTDLNSIKAHLDSWRPRHGEGNIFTAIKYINENSNNSTYRYINVVTSAYKRHVQKPEVNADSVTFGLGIMEADYSDLQKFASSKYCIDFAKEGYDPADSLLQCMQGSLVALEAAYSKPPVKIKPLKPHKQSLDGRSNLPPIADTDSNNSSLVTVTFNVTAIPPEPSTVEIVNATAQTSTASQPTAPAPIYNSSADCSFGYEGYQCTERALPKTGVYEVSGTVDLNKLFPQMSKRKRRSANYSVLFQFIETHGKFVVRSLVGCPGGPFCYWWLNVVDDEVVFVSPDKVYKLWDMVPLNETEKYKLRCAVTGSYLLSNGTTFFLDKNETAALELSMKMVKGNSSILVPEETIKTYQAEFYDPNIQSSMVSLSLSSCMHNNATACFLIRSVSSSSKSFPYLVFIQENSTGFHTIELYPKKHWHRVCVVVTNGINITVLADSSPSSMTFILPNKCFLDFLITSDSKYHRFLGFVKNVNVWSRALSSDEIQHVFTAVCDAYKGDILSSDQKLDVFGMQLTQEETPKSICRYCQFGWTLLEDSCYSITPFASRFTFVDQCKSMDNGSHTAIIDNDLVHTMVSKMIEKTAGTEESRWPGIAYRKVVVKYIWLFNDSPLEKRTGKTYWLHRYGYGSCAVYSTKRTFLLDLWPTEVDSKVLQDAGPIFGWDRTTCLFSKKTSICKLPAGYLDPTTFVKMIIVMPHSAPMSESGKKELRICLGLLLNMVVSKSTEFEFIVPPKAYNTGSYPSPGEYIRLWDQNSTSTPLEKTLGVVANSSSLLNYSKLFILIIVQPGSNLPDNFSTAVNGSIYALGLQNTSLSELQQLASKPQHAAVLPENLDVEYKSKLKASFQRFLQGIPSDEYHACIDKPCANGGKCLPKGDKDFTCSCPAKYSGRRCEFESSSVICKDSTLTIDVDLAIVQSLSGSSKSETPKDVMLYFENFQNTSECKTTAPTNTTSNETVYRLFVANPFKSCGLKVEKIASNEVSVSGAVFYEKVTEVSIVDTSVLIANVACTFKRKYGVGLRPDDVLSVEFTPDQNHNFAKDIKDKGDIIVLLEFYLDSEHKYPLSSGGKITVGSFLHGTLYSKTSLPLLMSLKVESCYLSPFEDPTNKAVIVELIKDNCPASNNLPKNVTVVNKDKVSFMFQVFFFKDYGQDMFIHCTTSICDIVTDGLSKCTTNCSLVGRVKRQANGDHHDEFSKIIHTSSIHVVKRDVTEVNSTQGPTVGKSKAKFLINDSPVYTYLLAGLILFTFLFFTVIVVLILYCLRIPNPEKCLLHARSSYFRGRSASVSPPRSWTVRAMSPVAPLDVPEPRRQRLYAVAGDHSSRPSRYISPGSSHAGRFSTFLGDSVQDEHPQLECSNTDNTDNQQNNEPTTQS